MSNLYYLEDFIVALESWGLTDVLLPFLLIFTIFFAIMQKTHILGRDKKNINMVFSLVVSLLVVIPHVTNSYPSGYDAVEIMNSALPSVSLVVVAVIMFLLLIGLFGGEAKWAGGNLSAWIAIVSFIIVVWIFGGARWGWSGWEWFTDFFGEDAIALIIIILVFGIIVAFITSGDESSGEGKAGVLSRITNDIKGFFGGGSG